VGNIRIDVREIGWTGFISFRIGASCGLVNTVMYLRVPLKAGEFLDDVNNNQLKDSTPWLS
jgi:hypothetical protein